MNFHGGFNKWYYFIFIFISIRKGCIILVDYKIQREIKPEFIDNGYGKYAISNNGGIHINYIFLDVYYDNKKLSINSFKYSKKDLIEVNWDGPRRIFGIKKIGTE